jgi:hypothetical protein
MKQKTTLLKRRWEPPNQINALDGVVFGEHLRLVERLPRTCRHDG